VVSVVAVLPVDVAGSRVDSAGNLFVDFVDVRFERVDPDEVDRGVNRVPDRGGLAPLMDPSRSTRQACGRTFQTFGSLSLLGEFVFCIGSLPVSCRQPADICSTALLGLCHGDAGRET
jgi:hypothetical protein